MSCWSDTVILLPRNSIKHGETQGRKDSPCLVPTLLLPSQNLKVLCPILPGCIVRLSARDRQTRGFEKRSAERGDAPTIHPYNLHHDMHALMPSLFVESAYALTYAWRASLQDPPTNTPARCMMLPPSSYPPTSPATTPIQIPPFLLCRSRGFPRILQNLIPPRLPLPFRLDGMFRVTFHRT